MTTIESVPGLAEIIASRQELHEYTDDEWALAYALASVFQQPDPSAEQCTYFIDDAYETAREVGSGPYVVTKLGKATGNYTVVVMVNGWLCGAEEGEGHIELTTISDLRGWRIAERYPVEDASSDHDSAWCVHVLGPDDVLPAATRLDAYRHAQEINEWALAHPEMLDEEGIYPTLWAVPGKRSDVQAGVR